MAEANGHARDDGERFIADLALRAGSRGLSITDLCGHIMAVGFESDLETEDEELCEELFEHIMSRGSIVDGNDTEPDKDGSEEVQDDCVSTAAERVFGIPELFDMIMSSVGVGDVLRDCRVTRRFHQKVVRSQTLQQRLFLIPDFSPGDLRQNELAPRCIDLRMTYNSLSEDMKIKGRISYFSLKRALGTGALWEEMYLSQPSLKALELNCGKMFHAFYLVISALKYDNVVLLYR